MKIGATYFLLSCIQANYSKLQYSLHKLCMRGKGQAMFGSDALICKP